MKYKLKKWYPSLPTDWKSGCEVILNNTGTFKHYFPINRTLKQIFISRFDVEKNPEYWEKVEEKSYEILSYKYELVFSDTEQSKYFLITSVKRLSDGEIFTLGDSLYRNGNVVTLEKIELDERWGDGIKVNDGVEPYGGECFKSLIKANKLFTTNDGVDIYKGDTFYYVNDKWVVHYYTISCYNSFIPYVKKTSFSTKEKAEEWVLWNTRRLSIQDIKDNILSEESSNYWTNRLQEIVKSRL